MSNVEGRHTNYECLPYTFLLTHVWNIYFDDMNDSMIKMRNIFHTDFKYRILKFTSFSLIYT